MNHLDHTYSIIESSNIGKSTRIWAFVHILPNAIIGNDCNICEHVYIENNVIIGDRVTIKSGVYIWDGITLEDNVFIGPNVTFTNDKFPRSKKQFNLLNTTVRKGATICANATILPGLNIGEYAMIGAGSVVTKNIPRQELWYGNPAKFVSKICKCGLKINSNNDECCKCKDEIDYSEE